MSAELTLLAAFTAGVVGSGHCGAMCGGIAGAVGLHGRGFSHVLLSQLGRIASYALAGAIAGALGAGFGQALHIEGWVIGLRAATGVLMGIIGLQLLTGRPLLRPLERLGLKFWQRLAPAAQHRLADRTPSGAFTLGLLWGWLPCGLVYSMLLAAALSGGLLPGATLMTAFGLGTLPALLALGLGGRRLAVLIAQPAARRGAGALLLLFGLWTALATPLMQRGADEGGHEHHHHAGQYPLSLSPHAGRGDKA
jgi:sulfite exporter TauE/SafE